MSEYIVTCDDEAASWIGNEVDSMEPVVRCRDCLFFDAPGNIGQWCTLLEFGMENIADGFCAWGERRMDA